MRTLLILLILFFISPAYCNTPTDAKENLNENPNVKIYMKNLEDSVKKAWQLKADGQKHIIAIFTIDNKGRLLSNRITTSNTPEDTLIAARAIESAAPFAPFPKEITSKTITIEMNLSASKSTK